ncbi:hypothetical protein ACFCZ3_20060 [Cellulosimicrobium cellulans]|uniref:DUF7336 domain-containing protein n=1 Tax=Cellulosimicrobium cellulans TaxID=1710 RepID=UPI0035DCD7DB
MKTTYVVTGEYEYEGSDTLGAFGSRDAAVYFANRVDLERERYSWVHVVEWRGPIRGETVLTRVRRSS